MKRLLVLAILMLVPLAAALDFTEDFEDDSPGGDPTGSYTYTESVSSAGTVVADGNPGQGLQTTGTNAPYANLDFSTAGDACDTGVFVSYDFKITEAPGSGAVMYLGGIGAGSFTDSNSGTFGVIHSGGGNYVPVGLMKDASGSSSGSFSPSFTVHEDLWYSVVLSDFDCTEPSKSMLMTVSGGDLSEPSTATAIDTDGGSSISGLQIFYQRGTNQGSNSGTFITDNICFGLVCVSGGEVGDVDGPSEFDSGLIAFAASAGFISQESQLFFALILIGLATVTTSASSKWVAPGRFKNYLLMGVQTLIAIFCVIAAFLDLWMFLVAFMLGLFAVRGGSEIRNSFHEIREALQRQNDRAGDDIGPTQVMEVQVNEERQEAVERAFQRLEDESAAKDPKEAPENAVSDDSGADS